MTPSRLAAMVTKSFVFMREGPNSGGGGKMFRAFDKKTGRIAWEMELPGGTSGAP